MPGIDLKAHKWTNVFRNYPDYPELLTQKHWDSKKGKIAKMAGSTGMGDQMKKTFDAYKKLEGKWVRVQGTRPVDVEKNKKDAIAFLKGTLIKNLHDEFKNLRDLAKETGDRFKKNKLIPGSAAKLCEDIRVAADQLFVSTSTNTLAGHLEAAIKENQATVIAAQKKQAGNILTLCKTVPDKIKKAVADWRKVLSAAGDNEEKMVKVRSTLKEHMFGRSRDMTQSVANFDKCEKAGVVWENYDSRGIQALVKMLVPYANGTGVDLTGLSAGEIEKHIKVIERGGVEFARLTKDIKIQGT